MSTQAVKNRPQTGNQRRQEVQNYASQGVERVQEIVQDNAGKSMLIAMASGLGIGILIGTAIGGSRQPSHWWDRSTAESLGHRLLDKIGTMVPDVLSDRIHR